MNTENKARIDAILEWLKARLESYYNFTKSSISPLRPYDLGDHGTELDFESLEVSVVIMYWHNGIIDIFVCSPLDSDFLIAFRFVPSNDAAEFYPEESKRVFVRKVKELLIGLRHRTPELRSELTADIHSEILNNPKKKL